MRGGCVWILEIFHLMLRNLCLAGENERELASIGGSGVTELISGGTRVRCTTGNRKIMIAHSAAAPSAASASAVPLRAALLPPGMCCSSQECALTSLLRSAEWSACRTPAVQRATWHAAPQHVARCTAGVRHIGVHPSPTSLYALPLLRPSVHSTCALQVAVLVTFL